MRSHYRLLRAIVIVAVMLIPLRVALAKGPPSQVTISGPGIDGDITIRDMEMLEAFSFYQFNDLERRIDAPVGEIGEGYTIHRWILDNDQETLLLWDTLTYYPAADGRESLLYFDGLNPEIGSTEGQEQWYRPSEAGDAAMVQILGGQTPAARRGSIVSSGVTRGSLAALGALIAGAAVVFAVRARRDQRIGAAA